MGTETEKNRPNPEQRPQDDPRNPANPKQKDPSQSGDVQDPTKKAPGQSDPGDRRDREGSEDVEKRRA
jgi:hypothetical protein